MNLCCILCEISHNITIMMEKGIFNNIINNNNSTIAAINKIYFATFWILIENFK
jgi:hypothetical protein